MSHATRRRAVLILVAGALAAGAAGNARAQPDAKAANVSTADATAAGREAYRYGLPLLEFLRVRRQETSVTVPDARGDAPVNVFSNARAFARPQDRAVVAPNVDTLYSIAHLDLGRGPVVLAHPDMGRRYFSFELIDPYTNVIGYVGSRTTGARAGRFAIAWSGRRNRLPRGVRLLRSPYRRLWMVGRTLVHRDADLAAARRAMGGYSLTPLDGAGRLLPTHRPSRIVRRPRTAPVLTGLAFLDALTDALAENPPPARDRPELDRLARVGMVPGHRPSQAGLPSATLDALVAGVRAEAAELPAQARGEVVRAALASHGWYTPPAAIGSYGVDYPFRAKVAIVGLGANTPPEAMYPIALSDAAGRLLDGAHRYRLTFARGQEPPARAFWSLTLYDANGYLVPNAARRYAVGDSHPPLPRRPDGSIVVAIQHQRPTERDVAWIPAPNAGFRLNLRLYVPRRSALTGAWRPPAIQRLD